MAELLQIQKTFHRSIFDCLNEVISAYWSKDTLLDYVNLVRLDKQKPVKILQNEESLRRLFLYAREVTLEYCSLLCGAIMDKDDSMLGNLRNMDPVAMGALREERLMRFLAIEVPKPYEDLRGRKELDSLFTRGADLSHRRLR
jgi:hypothetical protein